MIKRYGSVSEAAKRGMVALLDKYTEEERSEFLKRGQATRKEKLNGAPWHSEETKRKMSLAQIGKKRGPHLNEHRLNISRGNLGRKASEATRLKMSQSRLGTHPSLEARQKMSFNRKGRLRPEECKHIMRVNRLIKLQIF